MEEEKTKQLFDLCRELFESEQKKSGMLEPLPYVWAKNNDTGEVLIFSAWAEKSEDLMKRIKI